MKTYGQDLNFLSDHQVGIMELKRDEKARLIVAPCYQGRVMTSTAGGLFGTSLGWINRDHIGSGSLNYKFNPFGGEERLWIGPEGGPFSWFFRKGEEQTYSNWNVPSVIDSEAFDVKSQEEDKVSFEKRFTLRNASDRLFDMKVDRMVSLVGIDELQRCMGASLPDELDWIAYRTENKITNMSDFPWTKETGMPSLWLLGMYEPTVGTTVFIPFDNEYEGEKVNAGYFGDMPSGRLFLDDGMAYFKIDGEFRSKIGLPSGSAGDICGSYDPVSGILTILKFSLPSEPSSYVNSQWGFQNDHFSGDVINAYNDGPTETGDVMGPFYEMETSSPGAELPENGTLAHIQYTIHIQGNERQLRKVAYEVFGADLNKAERIFRNITFMENEKAM